MTNTRNRRPVLRSAILAIAFSGAAIGGLATTAGAATPPANKCQLNPASCTITTAPPVVHPGPVVTLPPVIKIPTPCTHGCGPTVPGDKGDKPLTDHPKGDNPGDPGDDKPGLDAPDKPKQERPEVETSSVDAPVVATATFTG